MTDIAYPNSLFFDDIDKANQYWNRFEIGNNAVSYQEKLLLLNPLFEQISSQNYVTIFIWDIVKGRFVYAVDKRNVVGFNMLLFLADNGIHFSHSNCHPKFLTAISSLQFK